MIKPNMGSQPVQGSDGTLGSQPQSVPNARDEAGANFYTQPISPIDQQYHPPLIESMITDSDNDADDDSGSVQGIF